MRDGSEHQRCYRCGAVKPADEFAWRRKERKQRDSFCRPCRAEYKQEHYAANRQRYIKQARVQKQRLRLERTHYLLAFFESHPCVDCGERDPVVLEFDHLRDKVDNVSKMASLKRPWAIILAEIAKCDVVCANCHRRRTAVRLNSYRYRHTRGDG